MLTELDARDRESWRALGNAISAGLRHELLNTPVGDILRRRLADQVELIRSIPVEAGRRVHELTLRGLENSTRAREIAAEIRNSGLVAESRAMLIARTEVSRTASTLTQTRAEHVGSPGYTWRTIGDADVRKSHAGMRDKFVAWDAPPTLDDMEGHAGCFPNCRCWPEPVLRDA